MTGGWELLLLICNLFSHHIHTKGSPGKKCTVRVITSSSPSWSMTNRGLNVSSFYGQLISTYMSAGPKPPSDFSLPFIAASSCNVLQHPLLSGTGSARRTANSPLRETGTTFMFRMHVRGQRERS
ncbi:hypothetical protein EDC04DRAFT_1085470 [Pisolithus marmoratus]|nr:hypothetical protein EDC04DRAFT_1085470 [Pisolithus marmoratus]